MRTAQTLYEGVNRKAEGAVGLITYMRTDSKAKQCRRSAAQATRGSCSSITAEFTAKGPQLYETEEGQQRAGCAHEGGRPTEPARTPERGQEVPRRQPGCTRSSGGASWRRRWPRPSSTDHRRLRPRPLPVPRHRLGDEVQGFLSLYQEGRGRGDQGSRGRKSLPPLEHGEHVGAKKILTPSQHFTEPPPRFSEATLVKALESYGIGRPSTYASIIYTREPRSTSRRTTAASNRPTSGAW